MEIVLPMRPTLRQSIGGRRLCWSRGLEPSPDAFAVSEVFDLHRTYLKIASGRGRAISVG
jgi:hypothetical protein